MEARVSRVRSPGRDTDGIIKNVHALSIFARFIKLHMRFLLYCTSDLFPSLLNGTRTRFV